MALNFRSVTQLYRYLALSDDRLARLARRVYRGLNSFSMPAPKAIVWPMLWTYLVVRSVYYWVMRVFICEPVFKAYCKQYGRGLHTGVFIHWIQGKGDIIVGDHVKIDGKCSIGFAARFSDVPTLTIGNNTGIGSSCSFTVGKRIDIGHDCRIASGVWVFDSPGHPVDPAARLAGLPPGDDQVRPVTIEDNVWIGGGSIIFPGVTIGNGSVIAAGSVVTGDVPPDTLVAGNPVRRIAALRVSQQPDSPIVSKRN